jgi:acetyl-CoA carboxylase carboxyl transferase subunit alpha
MKEQDYLDFERPILELDRKIKEMRDLATTENLELSREIDLLERKRNRLRTEVFSKLTRWQSLPVIRLDPTVST